MILVFPWVNPNRKIRVKTVVVQQGSFFLDIATGEFHHVIKHTGTSTGNVITPLKRGDFYTIFFMTCMHTQGFSSGGLVFGNLTLYNKYLQTRNHNPKETSFNRAMKTHVWDRKIRKMGVLNTKGMGFCHKDIISGPSLQHARHQKYGHREYPVVFLQSHHLYQVHHPNK